MQINANLGNMYNLNSVSAEAMRVPAGGAEAVVAQEVSLPTDDVELSSAQSEGKKVSTECVPEKCPDTPAPKLTRPVLFLHGYTGNASKFTMMTDWFSAGGLNADGGSVSMQNLNDIDSSANMFRMAFTTGYQTMEQNAKELKAVIEAICKATGYETIDIVAHSKGGLDVRKYLMDKEERVDRVVTLGTPHKGAEIAAVCKRLRDDLDIPVMPPNHDKSASVSLGELTVDRTDRKGRILNPELHELNASWDTQRDRAEFLLIGSRGVPTLVPKGVSVHGDGIVTLNSATGLKDAQVSKVKNVNHRSLPKVAQVMLQVADFLTDGREVPGETKREVATVPAEVQSAPQQKPQVDGFIIS